MATIIPQTPIIATSRGMATLRSDAIASVPRRDWSIIHSLTNPFMGGMAARARIPTRATAESAGRTHAMPPILSIPFSPVTSSMESTVSIISDLNIPWFSAWSRAAVVTRASNPGSLPAKSIPRDRHIVTRAMFSMLE